MIAALLEKSLNKQPKRVSMLDGWQSHEPQPTTLKQLSNNLNTLEEQYHKKVKSKSQTSVKSKPDIFNDGLSYKQFKQNRHLPRINTTKHELDVLSRKKKWASLMKQFTNKSTSKDEQKNRREQELKKQGKDWMELRGMFPLQGKNQNVFLHKHKMLNISRAVNLNRLRTRNNSKYLNYPQEQGGRQCFVLEDPELF